MPHLLVIVRDRWEGISPKTRLITQLFKEQTEVEAFYVKRNECKKFVERWTNDKAELATSKSGILFSLMLAPFKSPQELHDRILRRLSKRKPSNTLVTEGFVSILSKTLNEYLATSARSERVLSYLRQVNLPKIFLIDEFISMKTLDIRLLKKLGRVCYISQDIVSQNFDFGDHIIGRNLMYNIEKETVKNSDLVIACTKRDQLAYMQMGAKKAVFYPNIYPITDFRLCSKDKTPSVTIVFRNHWGNKAAKHFDSIFSSFEKIGDSIKVYLIGMKPPSYFEKANVEYYNVLPKNDYMNILSKSWAGVNIGVHKGGSNERKYDYAIAGSIVFSDILGCRGDILPHEYTFIDNNDLVAKLEQLIDLGRDRVIEMGKENREQALSLAEKQYRIITNAICELVNKN